MIRFFRHIRQRLLTRKKFSKYLLYAVGEILLVVVGILIALQVNNWNQERQERNLEKAYMDRLYEDLDGDLSGFHELQEIFIRKRDFLTELLEGQPPDFSKSIAEEWLAGLYASRFISLPTVRSATFDELAGSGRLTLIKDLKLRSAMADYYAEYALMTRLLEQPVGQYKQIVYEVFSGNLLNEWIATGQITDMRDIVQGYNDLRDHPRFKASVNAELAYTGDLLHYSSIFINSVQALQAQIRQNSDKFLPPQRTSND